MQCILNLKIRKNILASCKKLKQEKIMNSLKVFPIYNF